jgi:heat shock protein HtpX
MLKRFGLFLLTNLLVMMTLSVLFFVVSLFLPASITESTYGSLAVFSLVWGMGGSFISLLMSKTMAKWAMGVTVIDPDTAPAQARDLVQRVHRLARQAGLEKLPEVGVYDSPEVNAFATGPGRNNSLVAVSTGLMQRLNSTQVDAVLAHEVSHVANGDMVTMTLLQGIVNAFVIFVARVLGSIAASNVEERNRWMVHRLVTFVCEIAFSVLAMFVVSAFSRAREYRADAGAASLVGPNAMISALQALGGTTETIDDRAPALAAFKIGGRPGWLALLSTHPSIEDRIAALRAPR